MKKVLIAATVALSACSAALADEYVQGHVTKNGTYVAPHYRSSPDSSYNNNWSVKGNVNPYTGRSGYRNPTYNDRAPSGYGSSRCYGAYC